MTQATAVSMRSRFPYLVIALAGSLVFAGGALADGRTEVVDQSCPPAGYGAVNIGSDFGFELGQQFVPTGTNLTSVEIYFGDATPVYQETPVRVTIWKSESLDFTSGVLVGTVVQLVPEGPQGGERPAASRDTTSPTFSFVPPLPLEPGETYVIQVAEDQYPSNTDLSWRIGVPYPYGIGIRDGTQNWGDFAFQTFTDPELTYIDWTTWSALKALFD